MARISWFLSVAVASATVALSQAARIRKGIKGHGSEGITEDAAVEKPKPPPVPPRKKHYPPPRPPRKKRYPLPPVAPLPKRGDMGPLKSEEMVTLVLRVDLSFRSSLGRGALPLGKEARYHLGVRRIGNSWVPEVASAYVKERSRDQYFGYGDRWAISLGANYRAMMDLKGRAIHVGDIIYLYNYHSAMSPPNHCPEQRVFLRTSNTFGQAHKLRVDENPSLNHGWIITQALTKDTSNDTSTPWKEVYLKDDGDIIEDFDKICLKWVNSKHNRLLTADVHLHPNTHATLKANYMVGDDCVWWEISRAKTLRGDWMENPWVKQGACERVATEQGDPTGKAYKKSDSSSLLA